MPQKNKMVFLTAEHLEAQADARVGEAKQMPEGEARQNALRNAAQLRVYASMKRTCTTNGQVEIVAGGRTSRMPDYRAYLIGSDGHFYKSIALNAPDEAEAIAAVKQLVDGHDVELWQRDRKIGKFEKEK